MEKEILKVLEQINGKLDRQEETLKLQGETLKEHTGILSGLRNGQEVLKAEISELRLQNAKEIGEIKEQLKGIEDSVGVLKEDTWQNKKDIHRIKKTMGMS
ncbi:hypothetical protein ACFYKT_13075 [Cytobacillus sp. FJAT-53684]|uniref:Uncharacterized protein n=1 Tax=Cytobacillus mangrovibacter TaxID=3299024 RepID=A0ABW6JZD4_9BACI